MCVCVYLSVHTCISTCVYVCMPLHICICMYACVHLYVYMHICVCVCMLLYVCKGQSWMSVSSLIAALTELAAPGFQESCWPVSSRDPLFSTSPMLRFNCVPPCLMMVGNPHSGHRTCVGEIFSQLFPQSHCLVYEGQGPIWSPRLATTL